MLLPSWTAAGTLPPGEHLAAWPECVTRFGWNPHRLRLLEGLLRALQNLREAGCERVFLDGSFVTTKEVPGDYDGCWETRGVDPARLDPIFLDIADIRGGRPQQKANTVANFSLRRGPPTRNGATASSFSTTAMINRKVWSSSNSTQERCRDRE